MDIERINQLVRLVKENGVGELVVEEAGSRIVIRMPNAECVSNAEEIDPQRAKSEGSSSGTLTPVASDDSYCSSTEEDASGLDGEGSQSISLTDSAECCDVVPRESWIPVVSPVVGTFHASAAPGLEPFVAPGTAVGAGKSLGIVNALNIGNRIKAKFPAVVREVCVQDGDSVQNGTVLFYLEPIDELLQATLESE